MRKIRLYLAFLIILCFCFAAGINILITHGAGYGADEIIATLGDVSETDQDEVTGTIHMYYDDRYTLEESVQDIFSEEVTSYKTGKTVADDHVIALKSGDDKTLVAVGCGTAYVKLDNGDIYKVEVEAAPISLVLIAGQSNAEGSPAIESAQSDYMKQWIASEEGQVYSTYAPCTTLRYSLIGYYKEDGDGLSISNYSKFIPSTLAGNTSTLSYQRTNNLTDADDACGKYGIDSALAYNWNKLTGEKIWLVNAAHSGTSILEWQPEFSDGQPVDNEFWQAVYLYQAAEALLDKEIAAGHYVLKHKGYYWCQGEADNSMGITEYYTNFQSVHQGFEKYMSGDGLTYVNQDIEFAGILLPRANNANYTNIGDLYMNGARTALYYMCMSSSSDCSKIYLASDAEEYWGTDSDVENYFLSKYGTNEEYNKENPMVKSWNMPTTVATLHPNIHFSQLGHNEIGKTAAENIVYALNYAQRPDDYEVSISVVGMDGYNSMDSVLNMSTGETCRAVVRVEPAYLLKEVKVINTEGCVYNFGVLKCTLESGTGSVTFAVGNVSKKLNISYSAAAPVVSCESLLEGMQITWNKIDDAKCYYVYRRPISSTKWELMDVVSGTSCMDYNVYRYGLYLYTVKAEKNDGSMTAYNLNGCLARHMYGENIDPTLVTPSNIKLSNAANGVSITWSQVSGVSGYYIYRRNAEGSWSLFAKNVGQASTSYVDIYVSSGTSYEYTVRTYSDSGISVLEDTGKSIIFLRENAITSATNVSGGVQLKWNKTNGATGYYIFRRTSGNSFICIANIKSGSIVTYTDKTIASGEIYAYTIRSYNSSSISTYNAVGKGVYTLWQPQITSLSNVANGITIRWSGVSGATTYYIFRRVAGGSWKCIGKTSKLTLNYTDKTAVSGITYLYTIRAGCSKVYSGYDSVGKSIKALKMPSVSSLSNKKNGISISWSKTVGASGYYIYRKTPGGEFNWIGTVRNGSTTTFLDKGTVEGSLYTYTVRAYYGSALSAYSTSGKSIARKKP